METKMNLYQKLHHIQTKVIGLGKNQKSFGYDYVSGSKVLEHIKPLMNELGLILKQEVLSSTNVRMDYTTVKGVSKNEILTKLDMKFTWIDVETGDKDENLFGANGQNDFEKGYGSALTYAERYFLLKFFHIATDEDDIDNPDRKPEDNTPTQPKQPVEPKKPELPKEAKDAISKAMKKADLTAIWKANTALQTIPEFLELINKRIAEVEPKEEAKK